MQLYLIRHTSVDVPKGTCYGQTDVPLAATFECEAQKVKESLDGIAFDATYCSPLSRCRRLAEYCGHGDAQIDDRLMEINFGEWEMRLFDDIKGAAIEEWYADYIHTRVPGGESFMDQQMRTKAFLDDIKDKGHERVAVFTHGGIIMNAMLLCGMADYNNVFALQPQYGEIVRINL